MVLPTHREGVGRFKDWVGRALHGRCIHACACGAHHVELLACTAEGLKEKAYEAGGAPGDGRQLACVCTHMHACMPFTVEHSRSAECPRAGADTT